MNEKSSVKPWDKTKNETDKAHAAFKLWLDLGPERTLKVVSARLHKSISLLMRWKRKHRWKDRALAHINHMEHVAREAEESAARAKGPDWATRQQEVRQEAWRMGEALIAKAKDMLNYPLSRVTTASKDGVSVTHIHPARWSIEGAGRMIDTAMKLMALASGLPTDRTEISGLNGQPIAVNTVSANLDRLATEDLLALRCILLKAASDGQAQPAEPGGDRQEAGRTLAP